MDELELNKLCEKKRSTKKAIDEIKSEVNRRKLDVRRRIEDIRIDKELGLS